MESRDQPGEVQTAVTLPSSIEEVREDGTIVVKTNKNCTPGFGSGGRKQFSKNTRGENGGRIYRLPSSYESFTESVKLK